VLVKIRVDYELQPLEVGTAKAGVNLKTLSEKPRENEPGVLVRAASPKHPSLSFISPATFYTEPFLNLD
jgi:hypothetical protein